MTHEPPDQEQAMPVTDATHLRRQGKSKSVVIPKAVMNSLDWQEGEMLIIRADVNAVVIFPVRKQMLEEMERHAPKETAVN